MDWDRYIQEQRELEAEAYRQYQRREEERAIEEAQWESYQQELIAAEFEYAPPADTPVPEDTEPKEETTNG